MIIRFSDYKVLQILQKKNTWMRKVFPCSHHVFCIQDDPISWSFSHDVMGKSSEIQVFELMFAVANSQRFFLFHCHTCRNR